MTSRKIEQEKENKVHKYFNSIWIDTVEQESSNLCCELRDFNLLPFLISQAQLQIQSGANIAEL